MSAALPAATRITAEAMLVLGPRFRGRLVDSSVGSTFTFGAGDAPAGEDAA